jgi:hypothetical protein
MGFPRDQKPTIYVPITKYLKGAGKAYLAEKVLANLTSLQAGINQSKQP